MTSGRVLLLTGAAGRLGRRLLPALAEAGWRTRCLQHRSSVEGAEETVRGDLTDAASLRRAAAGADAILHLAAATHARDPRRYEKINVRGTRSLLEAARVQNVERFVLVSTRAISLRGGAYSRSKRVAEEAVRTSGLDHTVVRLPELYGLGGGEGVERMVRQARSGRPILIVGTGREHLCPLIVDDAIPALVAALDAPAASGKTYTLAGECLSVREFAERAQRAFGTRPRELKVPPIAVAGLAAAGRVLPLPVYPDQLRRLRSPKPLGSPEAAAELGFSPRPLEDGLHTLRRA